MQVEKTCEFCKHYRPYDDEDICALKVEDFEGECPKWKYEPMWDCLRVNVNDYDMFI